MVVIGLIGKIAAGKSTVARMFAEHGAEVIDADALAREAFDEPAVRRAIVQRFGPAVVADDGSIRRDVLATRVFGPADDHALGQVLAEAVGRGKAQALGPPQHELLRAGRVGAGHQARGQLAVLHVVVFIAVVPRLAGRLRAR